VVSLDGDQTVSVMQVNDLHFRPGERVAVTLGARPRLAPGAALAAGS